MKFRKSFSSFNWEMEVGKNVHFWWELPWCQKISGILDNSWIILGCFEDNVNLCAFESLFHILHRILVVLSHHASFNPSIKSRKYCLQSCLRLLLGVKIGSLRWTSDVMKTQYCKLGIMAKIDLLLWQSFGEFSSKKKMAMLAKLLQKGWSCF